MEILLALPPRWPTGCRTSPAASSPGGRRRSPRHRPADLQLCRQPVCPRPGRGHTWGTTPRPSAGALVPTSRRASPSGGPETARAGARRLLSGPFGGCRAVLGRFGLQGVSRHGGHHVVPASLWHGPSSSPDSWPSTPQRPVQGPTGVALRCCTLLTPLPWRMPTMTDNESEGSEDRELFEHLVDQFGLHGKEAVSFLKTA
jgi:hypothetical protein